MNATVGSVEYWAGLRPDDIAVVEGERTLTFGDWNNAADRLAEGLSRRGVAAGDIVGVRTQIRLEWAILSAALGKLINLKKKVSAVKGKLKLCCIHPDLLEVFRITRLDQVFEIYPEEQTALDKF